MTGTKGLPCAESITVTSTGTKASLEKPAPIAVGDRVGDDLERGEPDLLTLAEPEADLLADSEGAGAGAWRPFPLGTLLGVLVTVREELGRFPM